MKSRNVLPQTSRLILALYLASLVISLLAAGVPVYYCLHN